MNSGLFVSVEGGEGVGKSSFIKAFTELLTRENVSFVATREPGGTPLAESIRALFVNPPGNDPLTIESEFMLIAAARAQHVSKLIAPALNKSQWVICDRYTDSSLVYQGSWGGLNKEFIESVNRTVTQGIAPHITILLDCSVDLALARVSTRAIERSRFDAKGKEFHQAVRAAYLELAHQFPQRFIILDATKSLPILANEALQIACKRSPS